MLQLKPLSEEDISRILHNALSDRSRGYGDMDISCPEEIIGRIALWSNGDARAALKALELAVITTAPAATASSGLTKML